MFKSRPKNHIQELKKLRYNSQIPRSLSPNSHSPFSNKPDFDTIQSQLKGEDEYNRITRHAKLLKKFQNKRS